MRRKTAFAIAFVLALFVLDAHVRGAQDEDLEGRRTEIARELELLVQHLDQITARGAAIEERQEYVERILALREDLEGIAELEATTLINEWPPFRLVRIEPSFVGSKTDWDWVDGSPGYSTTAGSHPEVSRSVLVHAPSVIERDQNFELSVEIRARYRWDEQACSPGPAPSGREIFLSGVLNLSSPFPHGFEVTTENDLTVFCPPGVERQTRISAAERAEDIRFGIRFEFASVDYDGVYERYHFSFRPEVWAEGARIADIHMNRPDAWTPGNASSRSVAPTTYELLDFQFSADGEPDEFSFKVHDLRFVYRADGRSPVAIADYRHPEEFLRPPAGGGEPIAEAVADAGSDNSGVPNPERPESQENAAGREPVRVRIDSDGPGVRITVDREAVERPADPSREAGGTSGDISEQPATVRVADVRGQPALEAKAELENAGLMVDLEEGAPAPSRDEAFHVASQAPPAGTVLSPGDRVRLTVHTAYSPRARLVPNVIGLTAAEARTILEKEGLAAQVSVGTPAQTRAQSFTVISQRPVARSRVERGDAVRLTVFDEYREPESARRPDVGNIERAPPRDELPGRGSVSWIRGIRYFGKEVADLSHKRVTARRDVTPEECRDACAAHESCVGFGWGRFAPANGVTWREGGPRAYCQLFARIDSSERCTEEGVECFAGLKEGASTTTQTSTDREPTTPEVDLAGVWRSTYHGEVTFTVYPDGRVLGTYDYNNGRIIGTFDGSVLEGFWVTDNYNYCGSLVDGSGYWGRVRFEYNPETRRFEGELGYCDRPFDTHWNLFR